jgi:hypothetical protein
MNRLAALLAVAGFALVGLSLWRWNVSSSDREVAESLCRFGTAPCDASINWLPIIGIAVLGVAALVAAWKINQSVQNERAKNLVG